LRARRARRATSTNC